MGACCAAENRHVPRGSKIGKPVPKQLRKKLPTAPSTPPECLRRCQHLQSCSNNSSTSSASSSAALCIQGQKEQQQGKSPVDNESLCGVPMVASVMVGGSESDEGVVNPKPRVLNLTTHSHTISCSDLTAVEEVRAYEESVQRMPRQRSVVSLPPQAALTVLLASCRSVLCGSLMCPDTLAEMLEQPLREFGRDFAEELKAMPGASAGWEAAMLGNATPGIAPDEYGWGGRSGGLLQGSDANLEQFLASYPKAADFLQARLCTGPPETRLALLKANRLWCARHGWLQGSATEAEESRVQRRLFRVMDYYWERRDEGGNYTALAQARDAFLEAVDRVLTEPASLSGADEKVFQAAALCKSSLARVPTNIDIEKIRDDYAAAASGCAADARGWLRHFGGPQTAPRGVALLSLLDGFVATLRRLSFPSQQHQLGVPPTVIPVSPYASPDFGPYEVPSNVLKGFESLKLRTV